MAVLSFPRLFVTVILIISYLLTAIVGLGHCPLIPINGRENPSGAACTHPMLQVKALSTLAGGVTYGKAEVDVELEDCAVDVVEVEKVVRTDVVELVLLEVELGAADETDELDWEDVLDITLLEVELGAADETDEEVVLVETTLLELDPNTGLRLLYIDSRLAPPHFES